MADATIRSPQEFRLVTTLEDASKELWSITWSENQLLAAGADDSKVRICGL